ncbi:hypothetical protein [Longimicrobium sp.]|uniref:hypothetical protein n=1 Tax=Longimicrobium sp. TaxID=2029185 RepID=UPI002E340474|nr:hypothetical protein [Longimicrobium sp.]HEX6040372.1 hypothetical protein [Longimicrobium sp.]
MPFLSGTLAPLVLLVALAAVPAAAQAADSVLIAEASAFMDAYGRDLAAASREAIADRYDRRGVHFMFNAERQLVPWEQLREQYRTRWQPPAAFEWMNLVFEPAGPDAVVVNGHFFWTLRAGELPMRFRYTALLVRQDGALRIRLEDESVAPVTPAAPPAPQE